MAAALALCALAAAGCTTVPVAVGNPIPGMTVVAVAPFLNLSAEPSVDPRRFAIAYYTELQKTANYEVVPLAIVELAIRENELDLNSPDDAVKLARILHVDAVVIGAVTEYVPYYPPQVGIHVEWFSPRSDWVFFPGIEPGNGPGNGPALPDPALPNCPTSNGPSPNGPCPPDMTRPEPLVRGQSPDDDSGRYAPFPEAPPVKVAQSPRAGGSGSTTTAPAWLPESDSVITNGSSSTKSPSQSGKPLRTYCDPSQPDSVQPIMSYTNFFDGADRQLIQSLKGYYYLRGDTRSGGWEAYLHRSDDFLRFICQLMVVDMLRKHGAPLKTEKVCLYGR